MGRLTDWMRDQGGPAVVAAITGVFGAASLALAGDKNAAEDTASDDETSDKDASDTGDAETAGGKSGDGGKDGGRNRESGNENVGASSEGNRNGGGDNRDRRDGGNNGNDGGDGDHLDRQERLHHISARQRGANNPDAGNADASGGDNSGGDTYSPVAAQDATQVTPVAGGGTNGNASIQTPDGGVLAGYNPATHSMTATSGNVTASVGPNGPLVIISDEQVLNVDTGTSPNTPLPTADQLPGPQPGAQPTAVPNPNPNPDQNGGNPNDPGFQS